MTKDNCATTFLFKGEKNDLKKVREIYQRFFKSFLPYTRWRDKEGNKREGKV